MTNISELPLDQMMVEIIPTDGTPIGNKNLRNQWEQKIIAKGGTPTNDLYWSTRTKLLETGNYETGKGRGGSICKILEREITPKEVEGEVENEASLYPPFYKTIVESFTKDFGFPDSVVQITAHQGARKTGGKWSRPDIVLCGVNFFEYIPGKTLEVISFELKYKNFSIEGVLEAAAHLRFANKSYLCIKTDPLENPDDPENPEIEKIMDYCRLYKIGFITFEDPSDYETFTFRLEAPFGNPYPLDINNFLKQQFSDENKGKLSRLVR